MAIKRTRESEEMYLETILLLHKGQPKKKAEGIYERHQTLTKVLMKVGANPELAEENACRMEHVVSDEMMEVFWNYIKE